jgi:hypothetical protein
MKKLFTILIGLLIGQASFAQQKNPDAQQPQAEPENQKSVVIKQEGYQAAPDEVPLNELSFKQRLRIGGGFTSLSFGNPTSLGISPMVGYQAKPNTIIGVGASYQYYKANYGGTSLVSNLMSGRVFAMQYLPFLEDIVGNSFLQAEYAQYQNLNNNFNYRPSLLVGGGIGAKRGFNLTVLYDLNYDSYYSPYNSPLVLRIGGFIF